MTRAAVLPLLLVLAACQTAAPAPDPAPITDLPTTIEAITAQCRDIGGTPVATVADTSASVVCTRSDGVAETWTLSTAGR